jgi:putative transposase
MRQLRRLAAWLGQLLLWLRVIFGWRKQVFYRRARIQHVMRYAGGSRHPLTKPAWVHIAFFDLAQAFPQSGCRTLASNFNQVYQTSGHHISKTWAYERLKAQRHALALARQRSPLVGRAGTIGWVWGMDLTSLPLTNGESVPIWGIVDHGSRAVLQLEPMERFNSLILLGKLIQSFGEYGMPKAVRSDNASVFRTLLFRFVLGLLGIEQQFTQLHSPWQNGRIERFWRTLKETLGTNARSFTSGARILEEQMRFASTTAMREVLQEFQIFYNFSRPHQSLKGHTPAQVWQEQMDGRKLREKNKRGMRARDGPC